MGWAFVVSLVGLAVAYAVGPWRRRSVIEKRLASGSRTIADRTAVTLVGAIRAIGDARLEAPLSGREGVVIYAHAELPEVDTRVGSTENVTLTTARMIPFELETDAGRVLVDGTDVALAISPLRVPGRSAERERAFVVAHGRGPDAALVAAFRELALIPGMRVAVHGMAILEAVDTRAERGYRDAPPTRTRLVAPADHPISIGPPRA
jgi:hypothetical protein